MARLVGDEGVEEGRREDATWSDQCRTGKESIHWHRFANCHQSDSGSNSILDTIKEGYKRTNEYTTSRLKEKIHKHRNVT
jgi:hypothetical protein